MEHHPILRLNMVYTLLEIRVLKTCSRGYITYRPLEHLFTPLRVSTFNCAAKEIAGIGRKEGPQNESRCEELEHHKPRLRSVRIVIQRCTEWCFKELDPFFLLGGTPAPPFHLDGGTKTETCYVLKKKAKQKQKKNEFFVVWISAIFPE